ncbi:uncharacterized protein LOC104854978 [Fukomys damarensis]|uniref:uncharacterized protein LOC104854978 n=1 Tax=Fukomys damarensis TaxID=885580 RepID=UPI00053F4B16|nr:uncharacterized protein LOC104854978 [Fukomys damarensis]
MRRRTPSDLGLASEPVSPRVPVHTRKSGVPIRGRLCPPAVSGDNFCGLKEKRSCIKWAGAKGAARHLQCSGSLHCRVMPQNVNSFQAEKIPGPYKSPHPLSYAPTPGHWSKAALVHPKLCPRVPAEGPRGLPCNFPRGISLHTPIQLLHPMSPMGDSDPTVGTSSLGTRLQIRYTLQSCPGFRRRVLEPALLRCLLWEAVKGFLAHTAARLTEQG